MLCSIKQEEGTPLAFEGPHDLMLTRAKYMTTYIDAMDRKRRRVPLASLVGPFSLAKSLSLSAGRGFPSAECPHLKQLSCCLLALTGPHYHIITCCFSEHSNKSA